MREVFTDQDFTKVGYYQSVLESAGIATYIRNQYSHHQLADMPAGILAPQLCVVRDADHRRALELLHPLYAPAVSSGPDWPCPSCRESNPPAFEVCWNCGKSAPASSPE
jgi:hypothetical protein